MVELKDKLVEAVAKLIRLTQDGTIRWSSAEPPEYLLGDSEDYVETVFTASHDNRNLRLYNRIYKADVIPLLQTISSPSSLWKSEVNLEIVDSSYNPIWTFPRVTPLIDLLDSVRYQVADVNDFIEGLLKGG